ncbi:MAG: hypothetical protein JW722_05360 [Demequinaceae bacterium]|nr:hypothetical protein [Demequinaceae bacterium]
MDDILKKFKELSSKEQFGVYAGLALVIGSFLPFRGWGIGPYSVSGNVMDFNLGFLVLIGGAVGAVCIFLKQPLLASIGFACAALGVIVALLESSGGLGMGIKWGAFIVIAAAAIGVWATIEALISKVKESTAEKK